MSGTLGGGVVSVGLSGLILAYFCIRMLAVTTYQDPNITNYTVLEDRSKLDEPLNFADYRQKITFGFMKAPSVMPVGLDPRIGRIKLSTVYAGLTNWSSTEVPVDRTYYYFWEPTDFAQLLLQGALGDDNYNFVELKFIPCTSPDTLICASKADQQAFLNENTFAIFSSANFIDMESILPQEQMLQSMW